MHSHVAHAQCVIRGKLTLNREAPLVSLRVAEIRIDSLIEATASIDNTDRRRRGVWKLDERRGLGAGVGVNVKIRGWVTAVVEGQRTEVGQGVDAKAAANDRLGVVKRTIGKSEPWLEIAFVGLTQTLGKTVLTGGDVLGARPTLVEVAGVE